MMQSDGRVVEQRDNNDTSNEKGELERALRLSVKRVEDVSTSSSMRCRGIFEAIRIFFIQWESLQEDVEEEEVNVQQQQDGVDANQSRDLPGDYLKMVFCRMLSNLDPVKNVDTVREEILSILRSLQTASCRQLLLEFLPSVSRTFLGSESYTNTWAEGKSKRAKKQIFSCLRKVFDNEPNSLLQVLQYFSSVFTDALPRKYVLVPKDAFLFVLEILPKVPETHLHIAVRSLIQYVNNTEDARLAVDSVRTELSLLEKTDFSDMAPVATTFDEAVRGASKNQELFVEEYFVVIEELVNEQTKKKYQAQHDDNHPLDDVENQLLTFDLVMMIFLKDGLGHRDRILHMIANGSLLESGLLSNEHLTRLVELADDDRSLYSEMPNFSLESNPRPHLLESLTDFSVSFLLAPLHRTIEFETKDFFSLVQDLLVRVIMELPKGFQDRAISVALRIVDDLMKASNISMAENERNEQLQRETKGRSDICLHIFLLLLSLLSRKREILLPFHDRLVAYIMSESFDYLENIELWLTLCTVVARVSCNSDSNGPLDSIVICRTLLFFPPMLGGGTTSTQMEGKVTSRQIRGMMLANAIISCCDLDAPLLVAIHKMTSRVFLSPHSNIVMLDPRIGSHGMELLRSIRGHGNCDSSLRKNLFKVASLVLSHSRVVDYPDDSPRESTTKSSSIFAYMETPSVFPFDRIPAKQLRFRKMLFRFNFFFTNETLLAQPSSWKRSCLWVFDVIDTYLALGRTTKWNPRAWIFAGIEFPGISSSSPIIAKRKQKLLSCFESHFFSFQPSESERMPISGIDKQILELFKGAKAASEKEAIVDSSSRFTVALLFALSTSIAVLNNTYSHFKHLLDTELDEMECKEKNEALQMIHYQFTKIYDIEQGCHSMERLFRSLGSRSHSGTQKGSKKTKKRKLNRASLAAEKTNIQIKAETVALNIRKSLTKLLYCTESIPNHVFWVCLTDPLHDTFLVSVVENLRHDKATEPTLAPVSEVIRLRLNLIRHLSVIMAHSTQAVNSGTQTLLQGSASIFPGDGVRCLRLTAFLLLHFPLLNSTTESNEVIEGLLVLISEYLRLISVILISKTGCSQTSETNNQDSSDTFCLFISIFGSEQPLNHTSEGHDSIDLKDFNKLVSSFRDHIAGRHSPITSQLLEALSIFAVESGLNILDRMIDIHWNATFLSKYTNGEKHKDSFSGPPFTLVKLFKSLSRYKPKGLTGAAVEECCSHRIITKLLKHRYNKSLDRHQNLVHSMRRHWGLIALSPRRFKLMPKLLNTLFGKIVEYLRDVDDCTVGEKADSKDNEAFPEEDDDDDDDEYLPPSTVTPVIPKPRVPTSSDFHCLTSSSYPIYLDMLMRMTVSSITLFSIPEEMARFKQRAGKTRKDHPVYDLERMIIVYGGLVGLYKDKFHIFPKFLQSSIMSVSKYMLDVSVMKSQEYIEWRNEQPLIQVEDEESKGLDMASTTFLKKLLDSFGVHVIGTLHTFCSAHSGSTAIQGENTNQIQRGSKLIFGNSAIPGLKILARKTEKTFEFLSETSNRYGTGEVRIDSTSQAEDEASTKDSEDNSKMEHSSEKRVHPKPQKDTENERDSSSPRKRDRRRVTLTRVVESYDRLQSEDEESFIDENDESSSSASDAFGVSGDWGQESEDSDEEFDSEFVVDQFQKSS